MPTVLSSFEESIVARRTEQFRQGLDALSPAARSAVFRIAQRVSEGQILTASTDDAFIDAGETTISQRLELIALGKAQARGVESFINGGGELTYGKALGVPEGVKSGDVAGPADTSGGIVIVPWEKELIPGKKTFDKVRIWADWDDTIDDIRRKAREVIKKFLGNSDMPWRLLL